MTFADTLVPMSALLALVPVGRRGDGRDGLRPDVDLGFDLGRMLLSAVSAQLRTVVNARKRRTRATIAAAALRFVRQPTERIGFFCRFLSLPP